MLRIAIDAAPTLGHPTGVGVFTRSLLQALVRQSEIRVDAYALSGRGAGRLKHVLPTGVGHIGLPMPARPLLALWSRFNWPVAEQWTGPTDVVHGTNFVVPPTRKAAAVVTVHDLTAVRFPELCTPTTLQYPVLIDRAIQRGAHVHVVTHAVGAEMLSHFDLESSRLHVVSPGIPNVADVAPVDDAGDYLLGLGTIEPRKDYPLLVKAFDKIAGDNPDVRLLIAGDRGWGAEKLDAAISSARYGDRIEQLGWVSDNRRAALLRGAKALVYPSVYEGFGLPPLEAMSVGVPVVATAVDAISEVSADAALLSTPGDVEALAVSISTVLADGDERNRLVAAGSQRIQQFSWAKTAEQMVSLYAQAAKER